MTKVTESNRNTGKSKQGKKMEITYNLPFGINTISKKYTTTSDFNDGDENLPLIQNETVITNVQRFILASKRFS